MRLVEIDAAGDTPFFYVAIFRSVDRLDDSTMMDRFPVCGAACVTLVISKAMRDAHVHGVKSVGFLTGPLVAVAKPAAPPPSLIASETKH